MTIKQNATGLVTRSQGLHVREIRELTREADFVASTDAVDSYDEVIDQASWRLDRFKENPVILYGHQSYELPIGQATRCMVVGGQLEVTIKFATAEANARADEVWRLVQEKVLRAVSVGFKPLNGKYELREGKDVFVLYGCDLREISVVAIPANPECLAKMKAASLHELGVVTAAAGHEAETVRGAESPEMRERIRSAIAARDEGGTSPERSRSVVNLAGRVIGETVERPAPTKTTPELPAPSLTPKGAQSATEHGMDPKDLQLKLDASEKALIDAKVSDKASADKAATAEARIKALETERDTHAATIATLTNEHTKACTDRDANGKRASELEDKLIALEVDALIGKKIAPTEKDDFITLRKNSPDLFTSMVAKRAPMNLEKEVTEAGKKNGTAPATGDASDLAAEFRTSAGL